MSKKGDAFSRLEVTSTYVDVHDRFVVSLVVGFPSEQVSNAVEAAAALMEMLCGEESENVQVSVFDRRMSEVVQLTKGEVELMLKARSKD